MNKALIMLGSNDPEKGLEQVNRVIEFFQRNNSEVLFTEIYQTPYEGAIKKDIFDYRNALGWVSFAEELPIVKLGLKDLERQLGRSPEQKKTGVIAIDIDLLQWNEDRLKPEEWLKNYFRIGWLKLSQLTKCDG